MTLVLADRVRDTTTTTGTGTVTLSGTAPTGFQNFSVVGDGNTTYYTISGGSQWETGIGTYSSTGPTLTRTTVLASSNSGSLVNFSAGTKDVFVTYPAEKSVNYDDNGQVVIGVGGASDTALLDVEGNIYAASAIRAGGGIDLPAGFGNYWRASLPSGAYQGGLTYNGGLRFYSGDVVSERMRLDTSGNLGVGTSSPVGRLTLQGAAGTNGINQGLGLLYSNGTQFGALGLNNSTGWPQLMARAGAGLTFHVNSDLLTTGEAMRIDSSGNLLLNTTTAVQPLTIGSGSATSAGINLRTTQTDFSITASNSAAGGVTIGTSWVSGGQGPLIFTQAAGERMRIDASGNLGLGTSSPGARLDVAGGSIRVANNQNLSFRNAAGTGVARYLLQNDDNFVVYNAVDAPIMSFGQGASPLAAYGANANYRMVVDAGGSNINWITNGSERARIDGSGNLGVGTSTVNTRLNVKGGLTWLQNFNGSASSPTEAFDWPFPALNIASYGDFTLQTMMAFTLPNDGNYFTGDTVWNIRLEQTASSTTSSSSTGFRLMGPGYLAFGSGQQERLRFSTSGGITSSDLADAVGYKGLPQNQRTSAYTIALSDIGKHLYVTAGSFAITIPANSTTAFPVGTAITIVCEDAVKTVAPAGGVTLVLAGTGAATTGTRTLAIGSVATLIKVQTDRWYISGSGVT